MKTADVHRCESITSRRLLDLKNFGAAYTCVQSFICKNDKTLVKRCLRGD